MKFVNLSAYEVQLYWVNFVGEYEKRSNIVAGEFKMVDTYETHPWVARIPGDAQTCNTYIINNNFVYHSIPGNTAEDFVIAEIKKAPGKITQT